MMTCSETPVNSNPCGLVLEATNFVEAFESRLAWLSNQGAAPQSPDRIGINHVEITQLKLLFPAILARQVKHNDPEVDLEYLELWATPSHLYRDSNAPHYSLSWSLEHLGKGNPFQACEGLSLRRSYVFVDQDDNLNLLLNDNMFEFRTKAVLEKFMNRYQICRLFVDPNEYNMMGNSPMTCIVQSGFWEARRNVELVAVAKQYGICKATDVLRFVSIANGLLNSNARLSFQQLATMIKDDEGYISD